jgi:hypothetical protein
MFIIIYLHVIIYSIDFPVTEATSYLCDWAKCSTSYRTLYKDARGIQSFPNIDTEFGEFWVHRSNSHSDAGYSDYASGMDLFFGCVQ